MLGIGADDPHDAFSPHDLAVFADSPDAATNLHDPVLSMGRGIKATGESSTIAELFGNHKAVAWASCP
jgi:hypothetical protein